MQLNAGIDPLFAILAAVGFFIVKALLSRKQDSDSWDDLEKPRAPQPHLPQRNQGTPPPVIQKPGPQALPPLIPRLPPPIAQTQKQPPLVTPRPQPAPPRVRPAEIRPIIISQAEPEGPTRAELAKLKQSEESYARASQLQKAVANRLSAIDQQTATAKPTSPKLRTGSAAAAHTLRTFRNPVTIKQAFLASFVLNPPKALE